MFGELEKLRQRPIPAQNRVRNAKKDFRKHEIDLDDSRNNEPLIEISALGMSGDNHYFLKNNAPYYQVLPGAIPEILVREGILERLARVNNRLRPLGLELRGKDGWRSQELQRTMHDRVYPALLQKHHPEWDWQHACRATDSYWAVGMESEAGINPSSPPPHSTGAAVDLTLGWIGGPDLWMGSIFDDCSRRAHLDRLEQSNDGSESDHEALRNRRMLFWAMIEEGFVGHPGEWWHFSYGDQLWARLTSHFTGMRHIAFYSNTVP